MRTVLSISIALGLLLILSAVQELPPLAQGFPAAYNDDVQLCAFSTELQWYYCNPGDYNMDGEVNASDVTEVGRYFGAAHPLGQFYISDARLQVDGDQNGEINQADLVTIAANFGNDILGGYNVYCSSSESDYPLAGFGKNGPGAVLLGNLATAGPPNPLVKDRRLFRFNLSDPDPEAYYWVRAVSSSGVEYRCSNSAQLSESPAPYVDSPPMGPEEAVELSYEWAAGRLFWYYQNSGDYNQNSKVESSDLISTKALEGQQVDPSVMNELYVVDGDKDGVIGITDVLPIYRNYGACVTAYRVEGANEPDMATWYWDEIGFDESFTVGGRRFFVCGMDWAPAGYYRVVPFGPEGPAYRGTPSNWVHVP